MVTQYCCNHLEITFPCLTPNCTGGMTKGVKTFFAPTMPTLNMLSMCHKQVTEKRGMVWCKYERVGTVEGPTEGTHYASFTSHGDNMAKLYFKVSKYIEGSLPESFLDTLRSFITTDRVRSYVIHFGINVPHFLSFLLSCVSHFEIGSAYAGPAGTSFFEP